MLAGYRVRARGRKPRRIGETLAAITRLGRSDLIVKTFTGVLVPSSDDAVDPATPLLSCYGVRGDKGDRKRRRLAIADASGERLYDVGRPTRLCVPSPADDDAPALVCHAAKLARTAPLRQAPSRPGEVTLTNRFGTGTLRIGAAHELCVPTLVEPDDPPPDPAPFTLQVLPATIDVVAGTRTALTAIAHFDDGHDADLSDGVVWSSSEEAVGADRRGLVRRRVRERGRPGHGDDHRDRSRDRRALVGRRRRCHRSPSAGRSRSSRSRRTRVSLLPGEHEGYTVIGHFTRRHDTQPDPAGRLRVEQSRRRRRDESSREPEPRPGARARHGGHLGDRSDLRHHDHAVVERRDASGRHRPLLPLRPQRSLTNRTRVRRRIEALHGDRRLPRRQHLEHDPALRVVDGPPVDRRRDEHTRRSEPHRRARAGLHDRRMPRPVSAAVVVSGPVPGARAARDASRPGSHLTPSRVPSHGAVGPGGRVRPLRGRRRASDHAGRRVEHTRSRAALLPRTSRATGAASSRSTAVTRGSTPPIQRRASSRTTRSSRFWATWSA